MAIAAGVLLTLYLLLIVGVLLMPTRQYDPQQGQAIGCLMIIAMGIVGLGIALGIGVAFDLTWLVTAIFWVVAFPAIMLAVNGVRYVIIKMRGD